MARKTSMVQPTPASAEPLAGTLASIGAMNIEQLRSYWRKTFASDPPAAFSRDLLARAISYRLQAAALSDMGASTARLLRCLGRPGVEAPRQVKVGSVIIREYQGVVHEVLVVPGGFCWQGHNFDSLSTIAKKITGTSWNGPRFFGLRSKKEPTQPDEGGSSGVQTASARAGGRRSSVRAGSTSERAP
ncbi:DUF2924 domain-containing protein [Rhodoblastus sp. 17X3]|uniref:DUF2924 domain-containing protein n=1 Tax=Rhodoblastus sp. 17X3 TaxID=3047026 RepID=UPI0024B79526|nr:DUF2924 domain-containing protein [Rhodoblastus sp. 17X3]MDI9850046.1 DUF2924 domain-containing protein [Rhodoblastus sp. 17X3]